MVEQQSCAVRSRMALEDAAHYRVDFRIHLEASPITPAGRTVQPGRRIEQRYVVLSSRQGPGLPGR